MIKKLYIFSYIYTIIYISNIHVFGYSIHIVSNGTLFVINLFIFQLLSYLK